MAQWTKVQWLLLTKVQLVLLMLLLMMLFLLMVLLLVMPLSLTKFSFSRPFPYQQMKIRAAASVRIVRDKLLSTCLCDKHGLKGNCQAARQLPVYTPRSWNILFVFQSTLKAQLGHSRSLYYIISNHRECIL